MKRVFCEASDLRTAQITFTVTTGTDDTDKRLPVDVEMMEQAWILKPRTRRRAAGFARANELEDEEMSRSLCDLRKRTHG